MKRILFSILVAAQTVTANPLPPYFVNQVRTTPPQIWLNHYGPVDLSGDTIFTDYGIAIIDSGVQSYDWEPILLDSSNTSGFILNPESDSIIINLDYMEPARWGMRDVNAPPIKGHAAVWSPYFPMAYGLCFDFASPRFGATRVIINEISSHCTWNDSCNFIELYNIGNDEINLSGWKIICDTILELPVDARIHPHGYYVIDRAFFPPSFDMDSIGDNIYLIDADSNLVDQVGWSSDHGEDISFMRFPDGDTMPVNYYSAFRGYNDESSVSFEDGFPTRRAPNRHFSPGLKIIGINCDTAYCTANISWTNPVWLTVFTDAILRRSTAGFPETPYDGDIIFEGPGQFCSDRDIEPGNTYYYTIFARTGCGDYSEPDSESQIAVTFPTVGVNDDPIPERDALLECYPNPFNAATLIHYRLSGPCRVKLAIYNLAGQKVAVLQDGLQDAGEYSLVWDAGKFASGIYFARLEHGSSQRTIKLALLK
jgi:hypothetical protein